MSVKRRVVVAAAALALTLAASIALANVKAPPNDYVHVGVNDKNKVEIAKKVPIKRRAGQKQVSAVSLEAKDLGPIRKGREVRGIGEVQVSVTCTEKMPQCVGSIYRYSPHVRAQLVIAKSKHATRGEKLGRPVTKDCSQSYPNRNHHCVLLLDRSERVMHSCGNCSLNLVLTAWHKKAKGGNVLVVGTDTDHGIKQGKASISAAVFNRDPREATRVYRSKKVLTKRVPVVDSSGDTKEAVLTSVRIDGLKKGEALLVSARAGAGIGGLGYNVLTQSEVIVSQKGLKSTSNKGLPVAVVSDNGRIATQTGYNCTQGASDYRDPCPINKAGAAYLEYSAIRKPFNDKGSPVPLYVSLLAGFGAQYGKPFHHGDKVKVRHAVIRVERIGTGPGREGS